MKALRHVSAGVYADILRQIPAKLGQNLLAGHRALTVKIRNLVQSMGPGIGSAASGHLDRFTENAGQGCFQLLLNGIVRTGQPLPAPIARAIIAQIKPQIPHSPKVPL
jgi:hypothetical protein